MATSFNIIKSIFGFKAINNKYFNQPSNHHRTSVIPPLLIATIHLNCNILNIVPRISDNIHVEE
jgi:hypothetical protein